LDVFFRDKQTPKTIVEQKINNPRVSQSRTRVFLRSLKQAQEELLGVERGLASGPSTASSKALSSTGKLKAFASRPPRAVVRSSLVFLIPSMITTMTTLKKTFLLFIYKQTKQL